MAERKDNGRRDMLNRIRKTIQSNYTYCDIIYKPTAKQIAFLDDKIMAPILEDKDEYRLYYRILKAEEAMLRGEWESVSQYICGYAETGAIVLQIGKHIIPKPIQYQIAIDLYTDKGDLYSEIMDIVKNGKEYRPDDWNKEMPECVRNETTFTVYRAGKKVSMMQPNLCRGRYGEMLPSGLQSDMSITGKGYNTYIRRLFLPMM